MSFLRHLRPVFIKKSFDDLFCGLKMNMHSKISVLIVDDSALMRSLVGKVVESDPELRVLDKVMNGRFAFQRICIEQPDVIVLDLEMPDINGKQFLNLKKKAGIEIPVIILSAFAKSGAAVTMEALENGAVDFVTKPDGDSGDLASVSEKLVSLVKGFGGRYRELRLAGKTKPVPEGIIKEFGVSSLASQVQADVAEVNCLQNSSIASVAQKKVPSSSAPTVKRKRRIKPARIEIIAIGISTGGPNALRIIFQQLDPSCIHQPIVVVQHMPPGFTGEFAASLNKICPLEVVEAKDGDTLKPGCVFIAPGDKHILVEKNSIEGVVRLSDAPQRNGHRPSADVLFESVRNAYGNRALGIIMTGMGKDGAEELAALYDAGSRTIGQDEESCIVYGMPRAAAELGAIDEQVSLENMAATINRYAKEFG